MDRDGTPLCSTPFAQASLAVSAWELRLPLLSKSTREGLLGVMFDTTAVLPRQGAAVFAEEIRSIQGILRDRKAPDATALQTFDAHTAEYTKKLAKLPPQRRQRQTPGTGQETSHGAKVHGLPHGHLRRVRANWPTERPDPRDAIPMLALPRRGSC
jgi:hypothetical protein